jgi:O-antigen chain-terminating methyltransferase
MNTFIFKDKEIASLGLEKEIKRRVSEKIEKGVYNPEEIGNVSKRKLDILLDLEIEDSFRRFHYLYGNWDITKEFQITSHRPFIGPFIVIAKRLIRFLVKSYTKSIFKNQAGFNRDLILLNKEILKELKDLRKDVEALKGK